VIILDQWVWLSVKGLVEHDCVMNCETTRFAIIMKQMPKNVSQRKKYE
jgi:hypothetical protein